MTNERSSEVMTKKQKTFAKKYVTNFIGSEAYMFAYDTNNKKSAGVQACKLLKIPKIKEYIDAYVQEQLGPLEKDLMGNVKFWIELRDAKVNGIGKLISLDKVLELIPDKLREEILELEVHEIPDARPADRLKASEMLAKYRAMFVEKKDISVTAQVQIVDDI